MSGIKFKCQNNFREVRSQKSKDHVHLINRSYLIHTILFNHFSFNIPNILNQKIWKAGNGGITGCMEIHIK